MKRLIGRWSLVIAGLLLLAGTLGAAAALPMARLAIVNAPAQWFEGRVEEDITFDPATGLGLDLYVPPASDGAAPVLVFFYGGSWQRGDKADYAFLGTALAEQGYLVAIPDYRKYPGVRFPVFVEDGAAAVAWIAREISAFGGDPARIYLAGHSAGAHTAGLLASDESYLRAAGVQSSRIRGVAGLAGPYDFTPKARKIAAIFGPPDRYPQMQTSRFIDGGEPPMLLQYGLADSLVGPGNLERMEAAFRAKGNCHQAVRYAGVGHIGIIRAFTWIDRDSSPVVADLLDFFGQIEAGAACPRLAPRPAANTTPESGRDR